MTTRLTTIPQCWATIQRHGLTIPSFAEQQRMLQGGATHGSAKTQHRVQAAVKKTPRF